MTIKNKEFAFAIKYKTTSKSINKDIWLAALTASLTLLPTLKIEGLNTKHKFKGELTKVMETLSVTPNFKRYREEGRIENTSSDVILVGVSHKDDISFGTLADYQAFPNLPIYTLPVFDMEKDFSTILDRLEKFVVHTFKKANEKANEKAKNQSSCTKITYHSNFIRVGNSRIDYDDTCSIEALLKNKKPSTKKQSEEQGVPYILKNIFSIS